MGDIDQTLQNLVAGLEGDEATHIKAAQEIAEQIFGFKFADTLKSKSWGPLQVGLLALIADESFHKDGHLTPETKEVLDTATDILIGTAQKVFREDGDTCSKNDAFRLMQMAYFVGAFARPLPETFAREKTVVMREAKSINAASRQKLLAERTDLQEIANSRKHAEAIVSEFAKTCVEAGFDPVGGRQIQREAQDILKVRQKS
jgi:hypothetical protein